MNKYMNMLEWNDKQIPHRLWVEKQGKSATRLCMKIVKDVEPEMLYLDLDVSQENVIGAWHGCAYSLSQPYQDNHLYSQVRCLFNLTHGSVIWTVTHIELPDGCKISADKLAFIPGMRHREGRLVIL